MEMGRIKVEAKQVAKYRLRTVSFLCAGILLMAGCGGKETEKDSLQIEPIEQDGGALDETSEAAGDGSAGEEKEDVPDSVSAEDPEKAEESDKARLEEELLRAQTRHYYGGILSQITAARQLPDGELDTSSLDNGFGSMADNHFAVTDIDGDGREELIISYSNACMAGMFERVYGYDPVLGELKEEFCAYPSLTYYDNGFIKAYWSHNQGYGEMWPFTLYRYDAQSDSYVEAGTVDTWDKKIREQWFSGSEGQPFPDELDTDGDGTLYHICREGEEYTYAYEDYKYNKADYEAWYKELMDGAREVKIDYKPLEHGSFADYTPAYLKILAKEAAKERTDTEADLGLLLLGDGHFLEEAKALLSEKYGVVMEQPDPDFEEWTVGLYDGKERFTFEALNAGHIGYNGERVDDVTIFGIYPGISVDAAWEELKAYGFYASSYPEVENCLITGEGFENISIWFSEENGVVTTITVGPYCAFAG